MQDLLKRCYYDGMTVMEAVQFIERAYNKKITEKSIKIAKANIKSLTNIDWE
jgi:hypothetical protein